MFYTIGKEFCGAPTARYVVRRYGRDYAGRFHTREHAAWWIAVSGARIGTPDPR